MLSFLKETYFFRLANIDAVADLQYSMSSVWACGLAETRAAKIQRKQKKVIDYTGTAVWNKCAASVRRRIRLYRGPVS